MLKLCSVLDLMWPCLEVTVDHILGPVGNELRRVDCFLSLLRDEVAVVRARSSQHGMAGLFYVVKLNEKLAVCLLLERYLV